jgi:hypothetical protein
MARKEAKTEFKWKIYRLRGTPAEYLGTVSAPDEETALVRAIKEFQIKELEKQKRLVAQWER